MKSSPVHFLEQDHKSHFAVSAHERKDHEIYLGSQSEIHNLKSTKIFISNDLPIKELGKWKLLSGNLKSAKNHIFQDYSKSQNQPIHIRRSS